MLYNVKFHSKAVKELKTLDPLIVQMIYRDVEEKLSVEPRRIGEPLDNPLTGCYKFKYKNFNLGFVYSIKNEKVNNVKNSDYHEGEQKFKGIVSVLAIEERTREREYLDVTKRKEK